MNYFILNSFLTKAECWGLRPKQHSSWRGLGRKICLCFSLLLLAGSVQAQQALPAVGIPGLTANYYRGYFYDDPSFFTTNTPAIANRLVEQLNFLEAENDNFAVGNVATYYTPGNPDEFSGRFQGQLYITTAGQYTFYLGSDDAAYLWLDNSQKPLAYNQGDQLPYRESAGTCTLTAGLHTIRVDYGEHGGSQGLVLQYEGPGMRKQLVPNGVFYSQVSTPIQPVLTAFEAVANNQQVNLAWTTAAEENSVTFVIQKSVDGVTFTDLLRQSGAGTTAVAHSYQALDPQPTDGWNFYRLEEIRSDRAPVYSPIKAVSIKPVAFGVSIYPVPNDGTFFLQIQPTNIQTALLELVDMSGRRLYKQQIQLLGGPPQRINPELATGLYILYLTTSAGTLVQKVSLGD